MTAEELAEIEQRLPDANTYPVTRRYALETELHHRFARLRVHGEWFQPDPSLTSYIATLPHTAESQ